MHSRNKTCEEINAFIETQLELWPLARENFDKLRNVKRKPVSIGKLDIYVQYNPARIVSTGARTDKESIATRRCFLCASNRPEQQISIDHNDWEMLLNPFPILPVHFTTAHKKHIPQSRIPLEMAILAEKFKGLAFFFNGARAGASAPDHLHVQAVLQEELPIIKLAEKYHNLSHKGFTSSESFNIELPFHFISGIIDNSSKGMENLARITRAFGVDAETGLKDHGLVNAFMWIDNSDYLRVIIIPRKRHRPSCYGYGKEDNFLISPGALDMAGILVTPRIEDFERINEPKIREIYSEVAYNASLPSSVIEYFNL